MATKTVDNGATIPTPDFTSMQSWATYMSTLPDLTAVETVEIAKGTYNEGRIFINGPATTATAYVQIQAYAGSEHRGVTEAGVILKDTTGSSWGILNPEANLIHINIQDIEFDDGGANGEFAVHYNGTFPGGGYVNATRCIFNACYTNTAFATATMINCISFDPSSSFFSGISADTSKYIAQYCTSIFRSPFVAISGVSGFRYCISTNCVVMNYGGLNGYLDFLNANASSDYNASRDTSAPGAHSIHNLTDSDLFTGVGDGSWDFTPKSGCALVGAGIPIAGITTDIAGNTRSATAPTIGAFEFVSGGGGGGTETGSGAIAFRHLSISGSGKLIHDGSGAVGLHRLSVAGSGILRHVGSGAASFRHLQLAGIGDVTTPTSDITGAGAVEFSHLRVAGGGLLIHPGSGAIDFRKLSIAGVGVLHHLGNGAISFKKLGLEGIGKIIHRGSGLVTFKRLLLNASGTITPSTHKTGVGSIEFQRLRLGASTGTVVKHHVVRIVDPQIAPSWTEKFPLDFLRWLSDNFNGLKMLAGTGGVILFGTGTPEGFVTANSGTLFIRQDGGTSSTLYVKESGVGNTGWVAK